jgi:hypothetical protein
MKARRTRSLNAWVIIGYMPVVTWSDHEKIRGTLTSRLFHQCAKIIFQSLERLGIHGIKLPDSRGDVRECFPRLAGWLSDNPEQLMLNCAAGMTCPTTTAGFDSLGSAIPSPPRTTEWILHQIEQAVRKTDPGDILKYQETARSYKLNGVHKPFWKSLPGYRAELCVSPDIFHGVIRFWRDHILKWIVCLVGGEEIDVRLKALQQITGFRYFKKGITQLSQWTGREDKELQRVIVALIAGAPKVSAKAMRCIRAFHDFLYVVQYRSHSDETIGYLHDYLKTFHAAKNVFIETGVRRGKRGKKTVVINHFNIPKIAPLHTYEWHIPQLGSSTQFTTEIIETNHQPLAKEPFRATNKNQYASQMCRYLDRKSRLLHAQELHAWIIKMQADQQMAGVLASVSPGFRQRLKDDLLTVPSALLVPSLRNRRQAARLWLAANPNRGQMSLRHIADLYQLPHLLVDLDKYLRDPMSPPSDRAQNGIADVWYADVWEKIIIRVPDVQNDEEFSNLHTVEARPPDNERYPFGHGHCVLIHATGEAQAVGIEGQFLP